MNDDKNTAQPLAEVFGFPIWNDAAQAMRYRNQKLCPFNNKVPNCTKDKANNPLGVCSIHHNNKPVITCPVRFREEWLIIENAAEFAFPPNTQWTSLTEVKLNDRNGQSAGNIDFMLVAYDDKGRLVDFMSLEVQGVYISGNLRNPFDAYLEQPTAEFTWRAGYNSPKPDYLSSSRKRLIPQMLYKGGILKSWHKKQAVALQKTFFETLPPLPVVEKNEADIAWFLYELVHDEDQNRFRLTLVETVYTAFEAALLKITTPEPGEMSDFLHQLQGKLDEHLDGNEPDAPSLTDIISQ
jgi:hypothetical protein